MWRAIQTDKTTNIYCPLYSVGENKTMKDRQCEYCYWKEGQIINSKGKEMEVTAIKEPVFRWFLQI